MIERKINAMLIPLVGLNYMAWIGIVSWIGIPLLAFFTTRLLWRRSQSDLSRPLAMVAGVVILFTPALISNGVKAYYDRQVRELCEKDGGVRVYETAALPEEKFNQWGQPNFHIPVTPHNKLEDTDEYYLEWEITNLKQGNPKVERSLFRLIRRTDNRLLGESVSYTRSGGDLPGPWQGSSLICPEPTKRQSLESSVFVKGVKQ